MDSTNQEITLNGTSEAVEQPSITDDFEIDVNGKKLTLAELKGGYMRQSDYTRKTKELAEMKRQPEVQPQNTDPDLETLETWMDQRMEAKGYVKKDALTKRDAEQQMNMALQDLVKDNPGLKSYETAIKKLVESTGEHPADVVEKYLPDADKLMKAKSSNSDIMGSNTKGGKNVSFADMTPAQRTEWYSKNRDNIKNSGERFVKTGNV